MSLCMRRAMHCPQKVSLFFCFKFRCCCCCCCFTVLSQLFFSTASLRTCVSIIMYAYSMLAHTDLQYTHTQHSTAKQTHSFSTFCNEQSFCIDGGRAAVQVFRNKHFYITVVSSGGPKWFSCVPSNQQQRRRLGLGPIRHNKYIRQLL